MTTTLGTVIRNRREAAFLSQRELAHRINVSNGTISRIESGDGLHPDPQTVTDCMSCPQTALLSCPPTAQISVQKTDCCAGRKNLPAFAI